MIFILNSIYLFVNKAKKIKILSNYEAEMAEEAGGAIDDNGKEDTTIETNLNESNSSGAEQAATNENEYNVMTEDIAPTVKKAKMSDFDRYLRRKVCLNF